MRDIGYSLETALADLVDNSISAGATAVDIVFDVSSDEPVVLILDNGKGMCEDELLRAMRHGGEGARRKRGEHDLGRFGLGLKTASFSQCRRLTVVSSREGIRCGAEWNLDEIDIRDDWILSLLDESDIQKLPHINMLGRDGTVVIWRILDRLAEGEQGSRLQAIVNEKIVAVEEHLSLVFHRFLSGEVERNRKKLRISINGHSVTAFDPFCRSNKATRAFPPEVVHVGGHEVRMTAYILPHHSRMSASELDIYLDRSEFVSNQGCYIYRNGRLMAWGDWFRLIPKGESTKLARVQIDFQSNLDEAWTIDIKKSRAKPPPAVRERLSQIIEKVRESSIRVHKGRGELFHKKKSYPFWRRYPTHGGIRFEVDAEHPIIQALEARLPPDDAMLLRALLDSISASLPIEMIYSDYSTHPRDFRRKGLNAEEVQERLRSFRNAQPMLDRKGFEAMVESSDLFKDHREQVERFMDQNF